jgi:hypothetical protein
MDPMTKKMSESGAGRPATRIPEKTNPKAGERYRCGQCGMEIQVTRECECTEPHAHFECCGQDLEKE